MTFPSCFTAFLRRSLLLRELTLALLFTTLLMPAQAVAPLWWQQRGVVDPQLQPDDFAVINQGQLKNLAKAAVAEMNSYLDGGAGTDLNNLVSSWTTATTGADDYAVVNVGQLKQVARLLHQRLVNAGLGSSLPAWATTQAPANEDFAAANIGQAKNLFSFDLTLDSDGDGLSDYREGILGTNPNNLDTDGDGLPDGWEYEHGLDPLDATGANGSNGDPDNDGITNNQALAQGTHPYPIYYWVEYRFVSATFGMGQIVSEISCSDPNANLPSVDAMKPSEIQELFVETIAGLDTNKGWLGTPTTPGNSFYPNQFSGYSGPGYYTYEEVSNLEGSSARWQQFRLCSNRPETPADIPPKILMLKYEGYPAVYKKTDILTLASGPITLSVPWGQIVEEDENGNETLIEHPHEMESVTLLPVELRDIKDLNDPGDDVTIANWDTEQISDKNIAWIEAHSSVSDPSPRMPQLELRIPGLGQGMTIEAKIEVQYDRGNDLRTTRNQPEDRVRIPDNGNYQAVAGDTWRLWESYAGQPFFGGEATLTYRVIDGQHQAMAQQTVRFRIGGKNPDDARCRTYIETLPDAGPNGSLWFAYAIAKSESQDYNGQGSRYNQFLELPTHVQDVGRPVWGNDGRTLPGGYGMFQVTGNVTDSTANIPRKQIWNWQENCIAGRAIIHHKKFTNDVVNGLPVGAVDWMTRQRNANNANGVALPAHTVSSVTFAEGTNRTMEDACTMKLYNGGSRGRPGFVDNGNVPGFILDPQGAGQYCYWNNSASAWALSRYNNPADPNIPPFNYVLRVCEEVEP